MLLTPAPPSRARHILARAPPFGGSTTHGHLQSSLYLPERRAAKLARVLQLLDGSLTGLPQRGIAVALFGEARMDRDWHHPQNYLRDHVRRAVIHGRELMEGGCCRLLH